MKVVIVDYGMGNIKSIASAIKFLGVEEVILSSKYDILKRADKIILPGVGSFGKAMDRIKNQKIDIYLNEIVLENKRPLLGICLGMQLLSKSSTEDGFNKGLGYVNSRVEKFDNTILKVPHVGFNQVTIDNNLKLYSGFNDLYADFYFTHSYRMITSENINQCHCNYQDNFIASFENGNVSGTQFHPELSQTNGLKLLRNFIEKF